jgi:excisionase family DNA binding protein
MAEPRATDREPVALPQPLLRVREVAELLSVPESSVRHYARRRANPLPSVRVGRHLRFQREALERWLARCASR